MKLHKTLLEAVVETVYAIFHENKMADKAIQQVLRSNRKWGSRDRAFIAENCYDLVRWWRLLHYINETNIQNYSPTTIWKLLGIKLRLKGEELPEINEFKGLSRNKIKARYDEAMSTRKIKESLPDWLDEMAAEELGEKWDKLAHALNKTAPLSIRINTLKTNFDSLKDILAKDKVEIIPVPGVYDAAYVRERSNLWALQTFKDGLFEIQDAGSQLIPAFVDPKPGMRVIDACAGAGGKTLQLACLMENKGTIIAMDVEDWKLEELKKRAKRNGIHNVDARLITGKVIKRLKHSADAVLLDVPCSGLGVLRRNPDAKWKLKPEFIEEIKKKQEDILQSYSTMVKPGGKLVYATCSILPSENEKQVEKFLANNPNFKLVMEHHTDPVTDKFDGFYMALMNYELGVRN
ncbi:MAG: RsmB/NOP family class I SAM-dependent RNA methyltransferase [Saprospiraceae bacterium]|nr:RsmB/NOP family class I SAM-dependent RNA methyltransferase [Saprospiraceae bacterium]